MAKVSIKAVLIGNIVGFILDAATAIPLMYITFRAMANLSNTTEDPSNDQILTTMMTAIGNNHLLIDMMTYAGGFIMIIAGYISGRIAKNDKIFNGALASLLCVLNSLRSIVHKMDTAPSDQQTTQIVLLILMPVLAGLGGYIAQRQTQSFPEKI